MAITTAGLLDEDLEPFLAAGVLEEGDVAVADTLARLCDETASGVRLAAALAVRALRHGAVVVDLATIADTAAPESPVEPTGGAEDDVAPTVSALPWPEPSRWVEQCRGSRMVATSLPPGSWVRSPRTDVRPLTLCGSLVYLDRYAQLENQVRTVLSRRAERPPPVVDESDLLDVLDEVVPATEQPDLQRLAVAAALTGWVTVVAGGPGTGKTTTVARLLQAEALLAERRDLPPPRVALAAPTGRAAARMEESVRALLGGGATVTASTIHRLLGSIGSQTRFRHDMDNRLPYDVVVVDETSMVSLELMARLVEALTPSTRLVLMGDPDQLSSVDAGAVLADLVARTPRPEPDARETLLREALPRDLTPADEATGELRRDVVRLRRIHRFDGALASIADAIRTGDADLVLDGLGDPDDDTVEWVSKDPATVSQDDLDGVRAAVVAAGSTMVAAARRGDATAAIEALARHRLLCAHRVGPYGVDRWRTVAFAWLRDEVPGLARYSAETDTDAFYVGRPLLVTANDAGVGVFNGDTGVVVDTTGMSSGNTAASVRMAAAFDRGPGATLLVPLGSLTPVQTPLAMTVHKAQGSEAEAVTLILPEEPSPLLTREMLYTAVTRARRHLRLVGTEAAIRSAVGRPVVRASGLRQ